MALRTVAAPTRRFGIPLRTAEEQALLAQTALPNQVFQPLPPPTGPAPYRLDLADVLGAGAIAAIKQSGRLVFHCVGDTGGVRDPVPQESVIDSMLADLTAPDPIHFFYHLGDVVYYNGQLADYYPQFYEPYEHYAVPIFAIPGNHDGDAIDAKTEPSLTGFVQNFCATTPHMTPQAQDSQRDAMTQPNVYWTLLTPFATFIGLYSNCPDGGVIQSDQAAWLQSELASAPAGPVVVSLHHPIYSADSVHGGNLNLLAILNDAVAKSGRIPDIVFSGHVHNYQRFQRNWNGRQVPFIIAGAGGYHNLHPVANTAAGGKPKLPWPLPAPLNDVQLVNYCDNLYGYMRVTVTQAQMKIEYFTVKAEAEPGQPATGQLFETFTIDLAQHTVH